MQNKKNQNIAKSSLMQYLPFVCSAPIQSLVNDRQPPLSLCCSFSFSFFGFIENSLFFILIFLTLSPLMKYQFRGWYDATKCTTVPDCTYYIYIYIYIYKFVGHNLQFLMFNYFMSFFFRKYFMSYLNLIKVVSTFHLDLLFI